MFAYCGNNPVCYSDPGGQTRVGTLNDDICSVFYDCAPAGGGGVIIGTAITLSFLEWLKTFAIQGEQFFKQAKREIYEYSQQFRQNLASIPDRMPHVHHIVPVGNFGNRNPATGRMLMEMHNMLRDADISVWIDPFNLTLVSAKTHASLHTDEYIAHVYSYISATDGSREQIYLALFYLRIEIAAMDEYAMGY